MTQHLHAPCEGAHASTPARLRVPARHEGDARGSAVAAPMTAATKRFDERGTDGIWQTTAAARIAPVFALYHQRPKDHVT